MAVEDYDVVSRGFRFIKQKNSRDSELEGLVEFNRGQYVLAASLFEKIESPMQKSRIAYSAALQNNLNFDLRLHFIALNPLRKKLWLANTLLGTAYYNVADYEGAEVSFLDAFVQKTSERTFLDLLRVKKKKGENIYPELNEFYVSSGSTLSEEELMAELGKEEISAPQFKISGLHEIAFSLWE
jgi:hypothetical protein